MPHMEPPETTGVPASIATAAVAATFARLNARAWGIAFALLGGVGLLASTWLLVIEGGNVVGPHLSLLKNYLPGYSVSFGGGLIGFVYGFVIGYAFGRLIGTVYNKLVPARGL
ncbi:MAG: hypothetical protein ABI625_01045 [bacterium]